MICAHRLRSSAARVFVVCVSAVLLLPPGSAGAQQDTEELEDAATALSDLLRGLKGKQPKLPDRSLSGYVVVTRRVSNVFSNGWREEQCEAFGTLSLKPGSMQSYPEGQWATSDAIIHASTQMESELTPEFRKPRTAGWEGAAPVAANLNISTYSDQTYSVYFSMSSLPVEQVEQVGDYAPIMTKGRQCSLSVRAEGLPVPDGTQPFAGSFQDPDTDVNLEWEFWPNPCAVGEIPPATGAVKVQGEQATRLQQAVVAAIDVEGVRDEFVNAAWPKESGLLPRFAMRVSRDGCALPSIRSMMARCTKPGEHQGASHLLIGAVQQANNRTRATVRIVEAETGIVETTGRSDANGTDDEALRRSIANAMDKLDRRIGCAGV